MDPVPETIQKLTKSSENSGFQPCLQFLYTARTEPVTEIILSDSKDVNPFLVDNEISHIFKGDGKLPAQSLIKLLKFKVISERPKTVVIQSFERDQISYSRQEQEQPPPRQSTSFVQDLSPGSSDFLLKARIMKKSEIRPFKKQNNQFGRIFQIVIMDKYSQEISGLFFDREADRFFSQLRLGQVYLFSKGVIKLDRNQGQKYCINFDYKTEITPTEDDSEISLYNFSFVEIQNLRECSDKSYVDIVGIIVEPGTLIGIQSRRGEELKKRSIELGDKTGSSVEVTLWNENAKHPVFDSFKAGDPHLLVLKNARVQVFHNSVSLNTIVDRTSLFFDLMDLPVCQTLIAWASKFQISSRDVTPLTARRSLDFPEITIISDLKTQMGEAEIDSEHVFHVLARIRYIKPNSLWYESCKKCRKKVTPEGRRFHCANCDLLSVDCGYNYSALLLLQDAFDCLHATAFDQAATVIFKKSADDLRGLQDLDAFCRGRIFQEYLFNIRARRQSADRLNYTVVRVTEIDSRRMSRGLLGNIGNLMSNQRCGAV